MSTEMFSHEEVEWSCVVISVDENGEIQENAYHVFTVSQLGCLRCGYIHDEAQCIVKRRGKYYRSVCHIITAGSTLCIRCGEDTSDDV